MTRGEMFKYKRVAEAFAKLGIYSSTEELEHRFVYRKAYDITCKYKDAKIYEYGTLNGASAISIGMGIKHAKELLSQRNEVRNTKFTSIDSYMAFQKGNNEQIVSKEQVIENIRQCALDDVVDIVKMDDLKHIASLENRSVNMAWIDSLHKYEHVSETLELIMPKMAKDSLLCGHDFDISTLGVIYAVEECKEKYRENICGSGTYLKNWWCIIRTPI